VIGCGLLVPAVVLSVGMLVVRTGVSRCCAVRTSLVVVGGTSCCAQSLSLCYRKARGDEPRNGGMYGACGVSGSTAAGRKMRMLCNVGCGEKVPDVPGPRGVAVGGIPVRRSPGMTGDFAGGVLLGVAGCYWLRRSSRRLALPSPESTRSRTSTW